MTVRAKFFVEDIRFNDVPGDGPVRNDQHEACVRYLC